MPEIQPHPQLELDEHGRPIAYDEHGVPYVFWENPGPRDIVWAMARAADGDAEIAAGGGIPWRQALHEAFGRELPE